MNARSVQRDAAGDSNPRVVHALVKYSSVASAVVLGLAAIALLLALAPLHGSRELGLSLRTMAPNTALGLIAAGGALWLWHKQPKRSLEVRLLAGFVIALGAFTLLEYGLGAELGIDSLIGVRPGADRPLRMSPASAALFVVLGLGIVLLDARVGRRKYRPSEWLALAGGLTAFWALLGYLYEVRALYAVGPFSPLALETIVAFLLLSLALLFARPEDGLVRLVSAAGPGGMLSRRLLPAAFLVPVALGWLRLKTQEAGFHGVAFGTALFACSSALCFAVLIYWNARVLIESDATRRHAELRLAESEADLAITLDSIGDAVIATDAESRVTRMNPVAEQLTGWRFEEARGKSLPEVFRIYNESSREPVENPAARALRAGVVVGLANHTLLVSRDGTERAIADSSAPIRNPADGTLRGAVLVFRDQTGERNHERALEQSEARKAAVLEAALDCIVTVDDQGAIVELNAAAERAFGYDRRELVGKSVEQLLVPPALRAAYRQGFERALGTGDPTRFGRLEVSALRKDSSEFPAELAVARIKSDGPPMFTGYLRELTERKQAQQIQARLASEAQAESLGRMRAERALRHTEEQLRQSQKLEAIGKLAGGVAHDFNNLLTVIQSYTSLLLAGLRAGQPMRAELEEVMRAAERASNLTRQLLAFSRQQVLTPVVLDLNVSIRGLGAMLERVVGEDIELTLRLGATGRVKVDPTQIEQVLLNLVLNARDAMPAGGKLNIETSDAQVDREFASTHLGMTPGRSVLLSVSDTGVGMDRETQQRIFEPFFSTKSRDKGTGLGLSTAFGIVKQSGGSIWVYSEPGRGSTFKVYLPRTDALPSAQAANAEPRAPLGGSETVLLVEDDEQVRKLALTVLTRAGYHVLEAPSGAEALAICERHASPIELLLTDVVMPGMSGRQVAERVSSLRPDTKVLFMSGYTDDAIVHHGVLSADMSFIQKPLMPDELLAKLREVLLRGRG